MVTTPLAMNALGFRYSTMANVVTVHALGMYVPGFLTGDVIRACGSARVLCAGAVVYTLMVASGLSVSLIASPAAGPAAGSAAGAGGGVWDDDCGSGSGAEAPAASGGGPNPSDTSWVSDWGGSSGPFFGEQRPTQRQPRHRAQLTTTPQLTWAQLTTAPQLTPAQLTTTPRSTVVGSGTLLAAGVGWNLVFTTGSTMLVEVVARIDVPRAQGVYQLTPRCHERHTAETPPAPD
jgi:hypothetical protein